MNRTISAALGILIVLLVAGVTGASVLFFSREIKEEVALEDEIFIKKDGIIKEGEPEIVGDEKIEIEISERDEFVNWDIYRNGEHGFEFMYPKEICSEKLEIEERDWRWNNQEQFLVSIQLAACDMGKLTVLYTFGIGAYKDALLKTTLEDWIDENEKTCTIIKGSERIIEINGKSGIIVEVLGCSPSGAKPEYIIYIENKSKVYSIYLFQEYIFKSLEDYHNFYGNKETEIKESIDYQKKIFDKVISTFRFLD